MFLAENDGCSAMAIPCVVASYGIGVTRCRSSFTEVAGTCGEPTPVGSAWQDNGALSFHGCRTESRLEATLLGGAGVYPVAR